MNKSPYSSSEWVSNILTGLIGTGAEVDIKDVQGTTALHVAATYNKEEIVQLLLNAGAYT